MIETTNSEQLAAFFKAMTGQPGNNLIAFLAAMFSVGVALLVYVRTERRERRIEKSSAYLELEVNSSDAFRYQADNAHIMLPFRSAEPPKHMPEPEAQAWETTLNYYFQCLNLFEVCSNFRRNGIIKPEVFASWVAWFNDILKDWYFQSIWRTELRGNYTRDVRNIFDAGVEIYSRQLDPAEREKEFYQAVAYMMGGCSVVRTWLDDTKLTPIWPPEPSRYPTFGRPPKIGYRPAAMTQASDAGAPPRIPLTLVWNASDDARPAAEFASRVVALNPNYISHGEIQAGLSPDGDKWADNLNELYLSDFADRTDSDLLVARTAAGDIAAIAVLAWEETPRRKFAVLEDMAVDPDLRSGGVGSQVLEAVAARVEARGVEWLFLESGHRNLRAHAFFERHDFIEMSSVFVRRIGR